MKVNFKPGQQAYYAASYLVVPVTIIEPEDTYEGILHYECRNEFNCSYDSYMECDLFPSWDEAVTEAELCGKRLDAQIESEASDER
jgi:hypothetical protein